MVWCGVLKGLLPEGKGRDVYPRVHVNRRAVCVVCGCRSLLLCLFVAAAGSARRRGGGGGFLGYGVLVALPSRRAPPFGLRAAALRAVPAAPSTPARSRSNNGCHCNQQQKCTGQRCRWTRCSSPERCTPGKGTYHQC